MSKSQGLEVRTDTGVCLSCFGLEIWLEIL